MALTALPPLAVGLFGLGTGYIIWGGTELFKWPKQRDAKYDLSLGSWGLWLPGAMQLFAGIYLWAGLTVAPVFVAKPFLYMAAFAFTAFGLHWLPIGWTKYREADPRTGAWAALAFLWISITGAVVFANASPPDWPIVAVFVLLFLIYVTEAASRFTGSAGGLRLYAFWEFINGLLLLYLSFAIAYDISMGFSTPTPFIY